MININNIKKLGTVAATAAALLLASGCNPADIAKNSHNSAVGKTKALFFLAYDSPNVIRDQSKVATLTSIGALVIDGVPVSPENMRWANGGGKTSRTGFVVDVLPGTHTVGKPYTSALDNTGLVFTDLGNNVMSRSTKKVKPVTRQLEAGRIYNVAFGGARGMGPVPGRLYVLENTSPKVAEQIAANRASAVFNDKKR